jgi:hypothetical protein
MPRRSYRLLVSGSLLILLALAAVYGPDFYRRLTRPVLIGDGDSLMAGGSQLSIVTDELSENTGRQWSSVNLAVPGRQVGVEIIAADLAGAPRFKFPWVERAVWLIGGTNDLAVARGGPESVEKLLSDVETYFRERHSQGFTEDTCFYTDLLPRTKTKNPVFEQDRLSFNLKISARLRGLAHVIPSGANPALQEPNDPHYFTDGTHLTGSGCIELAADAAKVMSQYIER